MTAEFWCHSALFCTLLQNNRFAFAERLNLPAASSARAAKEAKISALAKSFKECNPKSMLLNVILT